MRTIAQLSILGITASLIGGTGNAQLQFTDIRATEEGAVRLSWLSDPNTLYRIQCADDLTDPVQWNTLKDLYPSHGTNTLFLDTGDYFQTPWLVHPRKAPARFYRVFTEGTNGAPPPLVAIASPTN